MTVASGRMALPGRQAGGSERPPSQMRDVTAVRAYIDKRRGRRQSNKVLHGHPSPVFWLDREVSIPDVMTRRNESAAAVRKRINLYVGTPYCLPTEPDRCGFCLFPSEVYQDRRQLDRYLDYLRREGDLFRPHLGGSELASIYFGGGTSNLYRTDQYAVLMDIVRGVFDVPAGIEVTLEGIPQTFSHEKLAAMKASGINRISMGVQQLDDDLIRLSGRRQTSAQVYRTIESCQALDLPLSIDLIFGWPNQTLDQMRHDLAAVVDAGVTHITHYELNVAGRTDFSRHRRHELPSTEHNLEMYRIGRDFLLSRGFTQATPYDFEHTGALPSTYLYEELFRRPFQDAGGQLLGHDAWGWGFAGVSFFFGTPQSPGWAYLNQVRVDEYFRDLDAGRYPVMRGFHYSETDLRLHLLFQELQSLSVDRRRYASFFGRDVRDEHRAVWDALVGLDWVSVEDDLIAIQGDGAFYLPLIQDALAHDRLEAMRRRRTPPAGAPSWPHAGTVADSTTAAPARVPATRAS